MKTLLKILIPLGLFLTLSNTVFATEVLYSQPYANASATSSLSYFSTGYYDYFVPGSLLTPNKSMSQVTVSLSGQGGADMVLSINCYTDSAYSVPCSNSLVYGTTSLPLQSFVYMPITANMTVGSTMVSSVSNYYKVRIALQTLNSYVLYPDYYNLQSSIIWKYTVSGVTYNYTNNGAPVLYINSSGQGGNFSYLNAVYTPVNDSVSPTIHTRFYFDFWYAGDGYTQAGIKITDVTTPQSVFAANSNVNSSGINKFDSYIDLTANHLYQWSPFIFNPTTGQYIYGSAYRVSAISQQSPYINLQPGTAVGMTASDTALLNQITSGFNLGTTTDPTQAGFEAVANGTDKIRAKVPFDYLIDMFVLLQDTMTGYNVATIANMSWTYTDGPASTTLTIMNPNTVAAYSLITLLRNAIAMFIYVIWAFAVPRFVMKLL